MAYLGLEFKSWIPSQKKNNNNNNNKAVDSSDKLGSTKCNLF